mgnify:CR=1 FL=1
MLNFIWPIFIILSCVYALFTGNIENINNGVFESCKSAVELTLTFFGTVTLWCGIMKIAENSPLSQKITKFLTPLIRSLFPEIKKNDESYNKISLNIVANMLGLGNAATPLGISAMESLQEKNKCKNTISNSMAMLILLNTASLQIIPTTIIAIRSSLNSTNPTAIILPVWLSSICAAVAGVLAVKFFIKIGK